jgi:RimJ/RimL family protein N-acetyltransferase
MRPLITPRLRLEFVTAALARIAGHGRPALEAAIGARLPSVWEGDYVFARSRWVLVDSPPIHALIVRREDALVVGEVRFEAVETDVYEIGYAVGAPFRREGIATEAGGALIAWLDQTVGAQKIVAGCAMGNRASVRTLRRLGFELDGSARRGQAFWWIWAPGGLPGY